MRQPICDDREALQAGESSSDGRVLILRGSGSGKNDGVGDPVPRILFRLAVHLASAEALAVKYRRFFMNGPRRDT